MGDSRRFSIFSEKIQKYIPTDTNIADVAGGKGYLQLALREKGFQNIETWDKRAKHVGGKRRFEFFDWKSAPDYDAIVAMHPDEGTDHSILYAADRGVPAFVCPCCSKGSAVAYWGKNSYKTWVNHLLALAKERKLKVRHESMKFNGRDDFFIFSP